MLLQKYSNHDIVQFLESIGAQFGACQNAHTSFDETVYELMVPTADLAQALSVFAQFAEKIRCLSHMSCQSNIPVFCPLLFKCLSLWIL